MDELDRNFLAAWESVSARLHADPAEARRRWRHSQSATFKRPPRAWCLALRASDTRIDELVGGCNFPSSDPRFTREHPVALSADMIRDLCAPVRIPWPGIPLVKAAALIGRDESAAHRFLPHTHSGRSRSARDAAGIRQNETYRSPDTPFAMKYQSDSTRPNFGPDSPFVWTEGPIDPNARDLRVPHPLWGSLWQWLAKKIPDPYLLEATRVPRFLPYRATGNRFRGWEWRCPGLTALAPCLAPRLAGRRKRIGPPRILHTPCGRLARTLYYPAPRYTLPTFLGAEEGFALQASASDLPPPPRERAGARVATSVPLSLGERAGVRAKRPMNKMPRHQQSDISQQKSEVSHQKSEISHSSLSLTTWHPGHEDPATCNGHLRGFACHHCWRVRFFSFCDSAWWNEFVSYMSAGVLYGREVEMPAEYEFTRRHAPEPRRRPGRSRAEPVAVPSAAEEHAG